MRTRCATALVAVTVLAAPAAAQDTVRGWQASNDAMVRVVNLAGSTRVTGWDRDSVAVSGTLAPGGRLFGGGTARAVKLGVEAARPGADPPAGILEVRVPRGATVSVKSATADVTVDGLRRSVEVYSVSGTITVTGDAEQVNAESMAGEVRVAGRITVVRAQTAGGRAAVQGRIEDLRVETVTGPIAVEVDGARQVRLESVSGPVGFAGDMPRDGLLAVHTHDGPVSLALGSATGADLELTTFDGSVENALAAAAPAGRGTPLRFSVNGGGARVAVRTLKGDITVRRR